MTIKRLLLTACVLSPLCLSQLTMAQDGQASQKSKKQAKEDDSTLYLESTLVGDREQPTVSYFIPWKGTGAPDNLNWNIEQKNDRTLDLVDRDVMVRSMSIYNELNMESAAPVE